MLIDRLPTQFNSFYTMINKYEVAEPMYFVFGSNLKGIHGLGAAETARKRYGAEIGIGSGFTGRAYAIPTKDENIKTLPLERIKPFVNEFIEISRQGDRFFFLTPVGCGLAGYKAHDIAPLFRGIMNTWVPIDWLPYIS